MKRRKWKPEQKALIVLEGLKGRPIGDLCAEHVNCFTREAIKLRHPCERLIEIGVG